VKATIDIPEDLYRKVKAKSALEGRPVRAVAIQLFREWVGESSKQQSESPFVSVGELMHKACGMVDSGVKDLATNPTYLEGLGRDASGHR
jgi:hypothetical protein